MYPRALPAVAVASLLCLAALSGCIGGPGSTTTEPSSTETAGATSETAAVTATPTTGETDATGTATGQDQVRSGEAATGTETPARPTVTLRDANGTRLGTVAVTVADSPGERYTGLSETAALNESEGMLFVYPGEGERTFVMRNMSFPLDIIFVAADGTITTIHHAPVEPNASGAELTGYEGQGKYVLEVDRGYANATGLDEGDSVEVPETVG